MLGVGLGSGLARQVGGGEHTARWKGRLFCRCWMRKWFCFLRLGRSKVGWKASPRRGVTLQTEVLTEEARDGVAWAWELGGWWGRVGLVSLGRVGVTKLASEKGWEQGQGGVSKRESDCIWGVSSLCLFQLNNPSPPNLSFLLSAAAQQTPTTQVVYLVSYFEGQPTSLALCAIRGTRAVWHLQWRRLKGTQPLALRSPELLRPNGGRRAARWRGPGTGSCLGWPAGP